MPSQINDVFLRLNRRAETVNPIKLVDTFVDAGPLSALLSSTDHQIMYGRRGTGKTHALTYLAETKTADGDVGFVIDMRTIGSTGGLYSDPSVSISERAARLLVDTLTYIHEKLFKFSVDNDKRIDLSQAGPILDRLANAATNVRVVGTTQETREATVGYSGTAKLGLAINLSPTEATLGTTVVSYTEQ